MSDVWCVAPEGEAARRIIELALVSASQIADSETAEILRAWLAGEPVDVQAAQQASRRLADEWERDAVVRLNIEATSKYLDRTRDIPRSYVKFGDEWIEDEATRAACRRVATECGLPVRRRTPAEEMGRAVRSALLCAVQLTMGWYPDNHWLQRAAPVSSEWGPILDAEARRLEAERKARYAEEWRTWARRLEAEQEAAFERRNQDRIAAMRAMRLYP